MLHRDCAGWVTATRGVARNLAELVGTGEVAGRAGVVDANHRREMGNFIGGGIWTGGRHK